MKIVKNSPQEAAHRLKLVPTEGLPYSTHHGICRAREGQEGAAHDHTFQLPFPVVGGVLLKVAGWPW